MKREAPIVKWFPHLIHGADYNPEQWSGTPEILKLDMEILDEANMNSLTVGIFSWAELEPEEGVYDFTILDQVMDGLAARGGVAVLATPSGARPHWLAAKYPEVLRVNERREKALFGARQNHCYTSPVYRQKVREINEQLARRYQNHPALGVWHVSNELSGECHCERCQEAFRSWLKEKYHNDLDRLNHEWWTRFWSHTYTDWSQIESPSPLGETVIHGLTLDWKRFVTAQTADFVRGETEPLRRLTPGVPVTANLMYAYKGLDYWKLKDTLDVISWDSYPDWHSDEDRGLVAARVGFSHDMNRCFLDKPFMLMESAPSCVNWKPVNKLLRPGMHALAELQAVSHGADTVQYFQFRKSRGGSEKLHAAVVDHVGHTGTRVFREIQGLGERLKGLDEVVGTRTRAEAAVLFDWENWWALDGAQGYKNSDRRYFETCVKHYETFWQNGISMDVIDSGQDFEKYRLVIAPMLYLIKPGVEDRLAQFVRGGGTVVLTYMSGIVNENDLVCLGGWPAGRLKEVFGVWVEETDSLFDTDQNRVRMNGKEYPVTEYCDLIHTQGAEVLGDYQSDFYAGTPAVTKNRYGAGAAYYIAFRDQGEFLPDFYQSLIGELGLKSNLNGTLPGNVTAQKRGGFVFLENFEPAAVRVETCEPYRDYETGEIYEAACDLGPYEVKILEAGSGGAS